MLFVLVPSEEEGLSDEGMCCKLASRPLFGSSAVLVMAPTGFGGTACEEVAKVSLPIPPFSAFQVTGTKGVARIEELAGVEGVARAEITGAKGSGRNRGSH
jgi:hypothetical protein